ncbi:MAG: hypothetical protein O0X93_06805 [Methanocorpusculum sp.]|nr:hypothetical protein [Methanocorpusculum sp.]MDE2522855.1 hypothetical protein [Methanocorpusculum sp.]MDE2523580.1 hypothetical protein [Methanocorpusculum sp.]
MDAERYDAEKKFHWFFLEKFLEKSDGGFFHPVHPPLAHQQFPEKKSD